MPYLRIQTNLPVTKKTRRQLLKEASALVEHELEKPEEWVMIAVEPDVAMLFGGSDDPVAFLELKAVGLPVKRTKQISQVLCQMVHDHLGIPMKRIYVKFIDVKHGMWGWKGDTF